MKHLSTAAESAGRSDLLPMWAGQSANLSACTDLSTFLNSLVEEVSEIAGPVIEWTAKRRLKHPLPNQT
jgi:nitronate monooxygenase